MFLPVKTMNSNWETLTLNLVTFKRSDGVEDKDLWYFWGFNPIFRAGSRKPNMKGVLAKKEGWTVCWWVGLARKKGVVFEKGCWYPNAHYEQSKQSQSNNKLLWKEISPSYHKEWKTFIKAICIDNIHAGEKGLCCCHFPSMWVVSFQIK